MWSLLLGLPQRGTIACPTHSSGSSAPQPAGFIISLHHGVTYVFPFGLYAIIPCEEEHNTSENNAESLLYLNNNETPNRGYVPHPGR